MENTKGLGSLKVKKKFIWVSEMIINIMAEGHWNIYKGKIKGLNITENLKKEAL